MSDYLHDRRQVLVVRAPFLGSRRQDVVFSRVPIIMLCFGEVPILLRQIHKVNKLQCGVHCLLLDNLRVTGVSFVTADTFSQGQMSSIFLIAAC